jgi:CIC family chloride channel protein
MKLAGKTVVPKGGPSSPVRRKYWSSLRRMLTTTQLLTLREEQFFLVLAVVIGAVTGLAIVLFQVAIGSLRWLLLGSSLYPSAVRVVAAPALAGLLLAFLVVRFFPRSRGSGVNQTKGALYIYDGFISGGTTIGKFLTSALAIGSGQSLGPEDPALQVGAGIASYIGRRLELSRERLRLLVPVGAAAGLAAAFNAPVTAVLFVIEEVIGRWTAGMLGAIVLSAISGAVVERWFMGGQPLFRIPEYRLAHPGELMAYAALGVFGGFASLVFVKCLAFIRPRLQQLPAWTQYLQPAGAGLLIGLIGIRFPQVMGAGYSYMDQAMHASFTWQVLAILAALKILTTGLSFASGTPGGLFAPTLFIGAMLGGAVGELEHTLFPHLSIPVGAYALVGMGTLFAGILRAPMTSVFMILEVSGNYSIILPVIISNTVAYLISRSLQPVPIFNLLSRQDGLDLPSQEEEREVEILRVEDAMQPYADPVLRASDSIDRALEVARQSARDVFLVQMPWGRWAGISRQELIEWQTGSISPTSSAAMGSADQPLGRRASMLLPSLYPDQSLETALRQITDRPFLPVVHRANPGMLIGIISVADVIAAYRKAGVDHPYPELQPRMPSAMSPQ